MEEEVSIVRWYISIFEGGKDTKNLVEQLGRLQLEHKQLKEETNDRIEKLVSANIKITKKYEKAQDLLRKQQNDVVKPLIAECTKREKVCQFLRSEVTHRTINLKVMFAMVGSPKLCDMFYKAQRKQYCNDQKKLQKIQQEHVHTLRQYKFDEKNAEEYVQNLYKNVYTQVNEDFENRKEYEALLINSYDTEKLNELANKNLDETI